MATAPGLIRFAARYTRSLHDAEDAYQRTMEIALTRAPVTETPAFMAWLHTVLRNEALAVARERRREAPAVEGDLADACAEGLEDRVGIDAVTEWRERYRSLADAFAALTEAQRICLMLQSAGNSYQQIHEITGYSLRKVERSVLEGRATLRTWEVRLVSGEVCEGIASLIDLIVTGDADRGARLAVRRHIRHCGPCRALWRNRDESSEWLAALVPLALVPAAGALDAPLDPSPVMAWWERVLGGATVRAGNAVQMAMELPGPALAKVGAGTAAVAIAGIAGVPMVMDDGTPQPASRGGQVALAGPERATLLPAGGSPVQALPPSKTAGQAQLDQRRQVAAAKRAAAGRAARDAARRAASRSSVEQRPAASTSYTPPPPTPSAPPPSSPPSQQALALEFGP